MESKEQWKESERIFLYTLSSPIWVLDARPTPLFIVIKNRV
jgi:hypothetical protein